MLMPLHEYPKSKLFFGIVVRRVRFNLYLGVLSDPTVPVQNRSRSPIALQLE
jgi:hypothetical protein